MPTINSAVSLRVELLLAAICTMLLAAFPAVSDAHDAKGGALTEAQKIARLFPIEMALKEAGRGAVLEYAALDCEGDFNPIPFPVLHLKANKSPLLIQGNVASFREVFQSERAASITESADGVIRIRIGAVPDAFLHKRIAKIKFTPEEQYSDLLAIVAIDNAPGIRAAAHSLGIESLNGTIDILSSGPMPGLPHLPRSMKNVTIGEILEMIAKTFDGIAVYGICPSKNLYTLNFLGGHNMDERPPDSLKQ